VKPEKLQRIREDWPLTEYSVNESVVINELCDEVERLRGALTTIRNIKSRDHNDPVRRLQHIDNIACQALGGDFHADTYVDEENQRLRAALQWIAYDAPPRWADKARKALEG
jgi:hypothetical protein